MDSNDTVQPEGTAAKWMSVRNLTLLLIVVQILLAALSYPFLPERVPSHWNWVGQVDGYMSRFWNALFWPGLSIFMLVLFKVLLGISLRVIEGVERQQRQKKLIDRFLVMWLLFILVIQGATTAFALGYRIDMLYVINVVMAVFLIVIGNYLGKIQRNFWAGIRTPWTLASEVVWERTHRLGGWLFVLAGMVTIVLNFFVLLRPIALIVPLMLVAVITVVYSYVIYQRLKRNGGGPLSSPFHPDLQ